MKKNSVKKSKQVLIISILISIALAASLIFFIIQPIVKGVYQTRDVFEEDKIMFDAIRSDAAQSHVFVELVENLGKDQSLVENALIKKESVVIFIQDIEQITRDVGNEISISQLSVLRAKKASSDGTEEQENARLEELEKEKRKVRLALEVRGNYKQFSEFLYKLENMTYVFQIESISVGNSSDRFSSSLRATEEVPIDFTISQIILSFTPKNDSKENK